MDEPVDVQDQARRWLRLMPRLEQWAASALRAGRTGQDPSLRQLVVLFAIREGIASPVELARQIGITRAVMTGLLDRLEQRGLLRREPDATDRRRIRVVLTDAGHEATDRLGRAVAGQLAAELARAEPADLAASEQALGLMERSVATLRARAALAAAAGPAEDGDLA